jgi:hypothetical protein
MIKKLIILIVGFILGLVMYEFIYTDLCRTNLSRWMEKNTVIDVFRDSNTNTIVFVANNGKVYYLK